MPKLSDREIHDIAYDIMNIDPADVHLFVAGWRACEERMTGGPMLSDEEIVDNCINGLPFTLYAKEKAVITDAIRKAISEARSGMFTEDDMMEAWCAGVDAVDKNGVQVNVFKDWLPKYKKEREHGEA